jgi:[protein-PII] uridylyltransferase
MKNEILIALEKLNLRREEAKKLHESGSKGSEVSTLLTKALDEAICVAIREAGATESLAAVAVGGYGRVELCPHSDVDVMFVVEDSAEASFLAQRAMHFLWDMGLNIGHSVRNIHQILETYKSDHDSWAATLEYRYVGGNKDIFFRFASAIHDFVSRTTDRSFVISTLEGIRVRHTKYGKSTSLLEPNVKKSAGGLRDLHSLLWIYRAMYPDFLPDLQGSISNSSEMRPAILDFLKLLMKKGFINQLQYGHNRDAFEFILRSRQSLHYQSTGLNDLLDFEIQKKVAASMGYASVDRSKGVESFMRDYFRHARKIYRLNYVLSDKVRSMLMSRGANGQVKYLDDDYAVVDGKISFRRDVHKDPTRLFKAFLHKAVTGLHFDENVHETLAQQLDIFIDDDFRKSTEAARIFKSILLSPKNVAFTLKSMNELGVLGRYLPEFGKLIGFFQHNVYHYYTADEHTLTAVENLENVEKEDLPLGEVLKEIPRRDVLYLGVIFHDIAKPISIGKHEIIGVDVAEKALARIGFDDAIDDVCFLVRNHLKMEQIAFRRNIGNPETVYDFSRLFANADQLKMLYLLTYADLSAVNPGVWTKWKGQLLNDLYRKTLRIITESLNVEAIASIHEEQRERKERTITEQMPSAKSDLVRKHFESIKNDLYAVVFDDEEIASHIKAIESNENELRWNTAAFTIMFKQNEDYTDVTIIARDAPYQLAKFCSALSANDANIVDANIFTRDDGVIIDRFKVFDNITRKNLTSAQMQKIEDDLRNLLENRTDAESLFERHRKRWQRKLKSDINPNIKIAVQTAEANDFTLVEVFAPDSLGFLYKVTSAISSAKLSIHFAKIATRVDGIVDTFYVLRSDGTKPSQDELDHLRGDILHIIEESVESELIIK